MHIAFVTTEFATADCSVGGLANYLRRLTAALVQRGVRVDVVVLAKEYGCLDVNGIHVERLGLGRANGVMNRLAGGRMKAVSENMEFAWKAYRRLRILHASNRLDLVQCASYRACGLFAAAFLRLPVLTRVSSHMPTLIKAEGKAQSAERRAGVFLERMQLLLSTKVFAPSERIRELLRSDYNMDTVGLLRSPLYLETRECDPSVYAQHLAGKEYVLFFGRYQWLKGAHILAEALPRFLEAQTEAVAVCAGADCPDPSGRSVKDYVRERCGRFGRRLLLFDALSHSQLYPLIEHAKLIVLPSLADNLPNALLEAIAFGRPVIGTEGTSFDEVLHDGENGFLVPPGDPAALAEKMLDAWNRGDLGRIGENALKTARQFRPERTVAEHVEYYEAAVDEWRSLHAKLGPLVRCGRRTPTVRGGAAPGNADE